MSISMDEARGLPRATAGRTRLAVACLGLLCALTVIVYAATTRLAALPGWQAASEVYFVDGRPVMTTADAYYSLRWAQKHLEGSYQPDAEDPLRLQQRLRPPRGHALTRSGAPSEWQPQRQPRELPLLSRLIALATPLAGGVERAALHLTPVLAALFVLPLYGCFARLGAPVAGLLGGLVTAFAPVYVGRTSLGDVDTDCLNLFFPWLAAWVLIWIRPQATPTRVVGLAAMLGVVLFGYYRWYDKPSLSLLYWCALALVLLVQRRPLLLVVAATAVCIVASHPEQAALCVRDLADLLSRYLGGGNPADGRSAASAWFPNVMNTVGELRPQDWRASLEQVLPPMALSVFGLGMFAVFAYRRWRDCLPLLPLLALASLTFISGSRFAIYLAPFVGAGLGIALSWGLRAVLARTPPGAREGRDTAISMLAALLLFGLCLQPLAAEHTVRRPVAVPAALQRALQDAATRMPAGAPVWTWWDYGYALAHLFGFAVYHDGGTQYSPQTNLIAWSLVTHDQTALSRTMDFVDREGNRGIDALAKEAGSREAMLASLTAVPAVDLRRRPKYLLFTAKMVDAASALSYAAGLPTTLPDGTSPWFEPLPCRDLRGQTLHCEGYDIDLASGRAGDGRAVRRFVIVDGGRVVKALDYDNDAGAVVELVIDAERRIWTYRVPDALYASNLNRMFVLGEYDAALFEEVAQHPGQMRMFRQKF